ncbi:unnamed protein product [Bursaphelenchus xylophilus]|uniref:(pine wood nematode) hypothetical protein n=1 Tax=Bursaphelenchus xylophilus TaxID=6326 RepID=A0A1I7RTU5_BURXY|nr:unnamed protein product [Bursaphelenchus xylophilus]CAG9122103.1 unnamed protein product [Bursaphelenchus xylophilus]
MASIDRIRQIYDAHDSDKNGVLSVEEAELAYKALGSLAKQYPNFVAEFNKLANSEGVITFEQFKSFVKDLS